MATADINHIFISGRMTKKPEIKITPVGEVCEFTLATHRVIRSRQANGPQIKTVFITCECWGARGKALAGIIGQGDSLTLEGDLVIDTWGDGKHKVMIRVRDWHLNRRKKAITVVAPVVIQPEATPAA